MTVRLQQASSQATLTSLSDYLPHVLSTAGNWEFPVAAGMVCLHISLQHRLYQSSEHDRCDLCLLSILIIAVRCTQCHTFILGTLIVCSTWSSQSSSRETVFISCLDCDIPTSIGGTLLLSLNIWQI